MAVQRLLALALLVVLFPLELVLALAVRFTSPGPIFYCGDRLGLHEKPFRIVKFRTLRVDAESRIGGRLLNAGDGMFTPLGQFLKRTKLDELPQLWNIVRGEMAFVGPRPCRPVFLQEWRQLPGYEEHFALRPGVTGIAQLRGGYYTPIKNKLRYERLYLAHRGPLLDLYLIALTLVKALGRWLTPTLAVAGLFLLVSWAPARLVQASYVTIGGDHVSLLHVLFLLTGLLVLRRDTRVNRIHYRFTAQDRFLGLLLSWATLAALLAPGGQRFAAVRSLGYLVVTGVLPYALVANTAARRLSLRHVTALVVFIGFGAGALFMPGVLVGLSRAAAPTRLFSLARSLQPSAGGRTAVMVACVPLLRYFAGIFGPQRRAWRGLVTAAFVLAVALLSWQPWEFAVALLVSLALQCALSAPAGKRRWESIIWLFPLIALIWQIRHGSVHSPGAIWPSPPQAWHWLFGYGYPLPYSMQPQVGMLGRVLFSYGAPGLIFFAGFWASFARLAVRGRHTLDPNHGDLVAALLSALAAQLALMIWQPLLYDPSSQVCIWMITGIATGCILRFSPRDRYSTVRWKIADHGDDFRSGATAAAAGVSAPAS